MKQLIQLEQTLPNNERLPSSFPAVLFPKNEVAIRKLPPQLSARVLKSAKCILSIPATKKIQNVACICRLPEGFPSICLLPFVFPSQEIADDLNSVASQVQKRDKHLPPPHPVTDCTRCHPAKERK